jgi:citrate synthase
MGIDLDLFPTLFAMARIPGLTAHLLEQLRDNRQLRPESEYVGPAPRAFVPIERRG